MQRDNIIQVNITRGLKPVIDGIGRHTPERLNSTTVDSIKAH